MSLLNKVAIVTGASSGIGAAIAAKFTEQGARVAIVGRNVDKLKSVSENCERLGNKPLTITADITDDKEAKRIITETVKFYGQLDILVNNAGVVCHDTLQNEYAFESFDKVMSTNLRSAVNLTHLSVEHLIKTKGNIVNISSICSTVPFTSFSYCTAKAGLDHFSRCAALELGPHGIRVNVVNPGPVRTNLLENAGFDEESSEKTWQDLKQLTLLKRYSEPVEIADLVEFLVSDKAKGITGAAVVHDNGSALRNIIACGNSNI